MRDCLTDRQWAASGAVSHSGSQGFKDCCIFLMCSVHTDTQSFPCWCVWSLCTSVTSLFHFLRSFSQQTLQVYTSINPIKLPESNITSKASQVIGTPVSLTFVSKGIKRQKGQDSQVITNFLTSYFFFTV